MRIQSINTANIKGYNYHNSNAKKDIPEINKPSFKGTGGTFYGMGFGAMAGMVALSVLGAPAILGILGVIGTGLGGGCAGNALEDRLNGSYKNKDDDD